MTTQKTLSLALQGGGSHGAFTWGVLDKLLEDGRLKIEAISATSAGSMNAAVCAYGMMNGGPDGAREALDHFWRRVSEEGKFFSPVRLNPLERLGLMADRDVPLSYWTFRAMTRLFSPYEFNPKNFNPLKEILLECIDFDALKNCDKMKLFISATHVKTGIAKVFTIDEMEVDVLMASGCLPYIFQAVRIEGEYYWDGGYMGNPLLKPLYHRTESPDILIVHVNPIKRELLPKTAHGIMNRINEITFNSSLIKELRSIAFVQELVQQEWLKEEYAERFKSINLHAIRTDESMSKLNVASKLNSSWRFLTKLRDRGRNHAEQWLNERYNCVGKRSTVNIEHDYLRVDTDHSLPSDTCL